MYLCLCCAVTDSTVRECIKGGCNSVDAVAFKTGAGTCCGGCRPLIEEMVNDHNTGTLKEEEGAYEYNKVRK